MTIVGMYDTVPLIHEAKKTGATLVEFLRNLRQDSIFSTRSNVLLLGSELSDLGLTNGAKACIRATCLYKTCLANKRTGHRCCDVLALGKVSALLMLPQACSDTQPLKRLRVCWTHS